jgi:amidase
MKRLTRDKHTTTLDPNQEPAITIASGEELLVETWDAFMGVREGLDTYSPLGPATGPIYVEGAARGDALRVEVLSIDVTGSALHQVRPGHGFLPERFDRSYPTVMSIEDGHLRLENGLKVPLRPSVGLIATSPGRVQQTASDSGPYGGDIDVKELVAGSTIWLPVFVEGALLVMGDMHAVVGDGAVGGTGAEVAAESHLRITVEKGERGKRLRNPRALTPDFFITMSSAKRTSIAMKQAVGAMVDFLAEEKGMDPYDAYSILSLAGDVRISRTFRPISPCKMMLARSVLDQLS